MFCSRKVWENKNLLSCILLEFYLLISRWGTSSPHTGHRLFKGEVVFSPPSLFTPSWIINVCSWTFCRTQRCISPRWRRTWCAGRTVCGLTALQTGSSSSWRPTTPRRRTRPTSCPGRPSWTKSAATSATSRTTGEEELRLFKSLVIIEMKSNATESKKFSLCAAGVWCCPTLWRTRRARRNPGIPCCSNCGLSSSCPSPKTSAASKTTWGRSERNAPSRAGASVNTSWSRWGRVCRLKCHVDVFICVSFVFVWLCRRSWPLSSRCCSSLKMLWSSTMNLMLFLLSMSLTLGLEVSSDSDYCGSLYNSCNLSDYF